MRGECGMNVLSSNAPLWIWEGGSLMSMPQPTVVNRARHHREGPDAFSP